jgi:hypothetical protein
MQVEMTAVELTELHRGKRVARFRSKRADPCDILAIEFSDGSVVVFDAEFEQKADHNGCVTGKAPIYVMGEKSRRNNHGSGLTDGG